MGHLPKDLSSLMYLLTYMHYSKEECVEALKEAEEKLGESPSKDQYKELDISPSVYTIVRAFDGWNDAKEAAGLETFYGRRREHFRTELLKNYVNDSVWDDIPPSTKSRLVKKSKVSRIKLEMGCKNCGYDENPVPLEFHHRDKEEKEFNVSRDFSRSFVGWDKAKEEMKKCDILCANCHRQEEAKYFQ